MLSTFDTELIIDSNGLIILLSITLLIVSDKVCMYEEMMMNNDNVESSLLTSILLNIRNLYK